VTDYTKLVALGVSEVPAVVMLVILGPEAWRSFRRATAGESELISLVHEFTRGGQESDHLSVAWNVRRAVVRHTDEEKRPRPRTGLPAGPWALTLDEPRLDVKYLSKRGVEGESSLEIAGSNEDVREHDDLCAW
jgi:hypothetical protein